MASNMGEAPAGNIMSSNSLARYIFASLPQTASPQIKNSYDAIALSAHAAFLAVGFRLVGLGEDYNIEGSSDPSQPARLPSEWNAVKGSYAFRYKHQQSSMEYLLKVYSMGNKCVIMGMGMGDDRTCSFDVRTQDYVSDGNLPASPLTPNPNEDDAIRTIIDVFISNGRLSDLGNLMRLQIIQKLIPGLQKEGYEDTRESSSSTSQQPRHPAPGREDDRPTYDPLREQRDPLARPYPYGDPLLVQPPRRPMPEPIPGFEDEFETQRGPRMPGRVPNIGERDLYPQGLGPNDPFYGGVGPGLAPMGGGGMHPTFDDPLFAGQGQRGGAYDPRMPPGSRFDPVGPGMGGHPRGAGMGGRPPNPFGGFGQGDFI